MTSDVNVGVMYRKPSLTYELFSELVCHLKLSVSALNRLDSSAERENEQTYPKPPHVNLPEEQSIIAKDSVLRAEVLVHNGT